LIVLTVIAVAIGIVNFFVIPVFAQIFAASKVPLPLVTQILVASSNWFIAYWWLLGAVLAGAVFGFIGFTRTPHGRLAWDRAKLRLPVAGPIIRKATLSRFARSFSIASRAGLPIVQTLTVVAGVVDNAFIARRIERMREGVERGEGISRTAKETGIFTSVVLQMVSVGEETGELDELLGEVADMYDREVDYDIKNLSAAVEPIITVALGILVLILALGIFLPMWQMGSVMLKK
jgi:MSHA biogenesis protein MshG